MMVCRNCGAEIDDKATSCPYCNAMQYAASEAEYMNNLYKMNSQMDNLDDEANKYVFSSVLKSAAIIIICIAAAVLIGIFWGFMRYRADNNSSAERKKIHQSIEWYDNNVSKLDEAYAKADYNTVSELVDGYKGNSSVIQKWNHYSFITLYGSYYRRVNDIYNKNDIIRFDKSLFTDHKAIISGYDSNGYPLIDSNSFNISNMPFDLGWKEKNIKLSY